jgi:prepilin-type N-terminal cleavage/methylation domain-containing protein
MPLVLHRGKDRRAGTAGFTLVELSVVIFMMGVLTALLLPALSTAKEKSRRAVCQSNIHQLLQVFFTYANGNEDRLPSSADNLGYYHSIRLSDEMFTNLVNLAGSSNIFYCPNIVFGSLPNSVMQHDSYGYVIGYSYLASAIQTTTKGNDVWMSPTKFTDSPTNELIADANYWSSDQTSGSFPGGMKVAPHGAMGASTAGGSSFTVGLQNANAQKIPSESAGIGAVGGNIGRLDFSVSWRSISQMQTYTASSQLDGFGNW